jgi:MFS family permease
MSAACTATGLLSPDWTTITITAVAIAYSGTAISFQGVLISEIARLAPPNKVGPITGGVFAFASAGFMIYPSVFGVILQVSGSYGYGFIVGALPALLVGILFFRRTRPEQPTPLP